MMAKNIIRMFSCGIMAMVLTAPFTITSCTDKVDESDLYTFTGEMMTDYLKNDSSLSLFQSLTKRVTLSNYTKSTLAELLSTRGNYTCFAPVNSAVQAFADSIVGEKNADLALLPDSIVDNIVKSSIIDNGSEKGILTTSIDYARALEQPNMNDRYIVVGFDSVGGGITVNVKSKIVAKDIEVENGVVHKLDKVLSPSTKRLPNMLTQVSNTKIFGYLLEQTGWADSMMAFRDEAYENFAHENPKGVDEHETTLIDRPTKRNYGFTAFVETDDVFEEAFGFKLELNEEGAVSNWSEVLAAISAKCSEFYPDATSTDIKSEDNALNQFVSYHLLNAAIPPNFLVIHYNELGYAYSKGLENSINTWNYYETMGKQRRTLKITEGGTLGTNGEKRINRYSKYANGLHDDFHEVDVPRPGVLISIDNGNEENQAENGYYYPIDQLLIYDQDVPNKVLNERMRYDVCDLLPELVTNGMRRASAGQIKFPFAGYPYFDALTFTDESIPVYLSGQGQGWRNYMGDEFNIHGQYDVTLRLPAVPTDGTYEIRYGMSVNELRGMVQVYVGTDKRNLPATGLPMDLRLLGDDPGVGWFKDTDCSDDEEIYANDKIMKTHGYMKAPKCFGLDKQGSEVKESIRDVLTGNYYTMRKIIWTGNMKPGETYYLRLKSVLKSTKSELFLDYIELVPKSVYNGTELEDAW